MSVRRSGVFRFIDTQYGSPKGCYVKSFSDFVSGRLTAAMVGRGPQPATRYSTTLSRSTLINYGRPRWTQLDCVRLLCPLLTAKAP